MSHDPRNGPNPADIPPVAAARAGKAAGLCLANAGCREAATTYHGGPFGEVPSCDRCAALYRERGGRYRTAEEWEQWLYEATISAREEGALTGEGGGCAFEGDHEGKGSPSAVVLFGGVAHAVCPAHEAIARGRFMAGQD